MSFSWLETMCGMIKGTISHLLTDNNAHLVNVTGRRTDKGL